MQEDVLGARQTVVGERYDVCTRCGHPVPRDRLAAGSVVHMVGEGPRLPFTERTEATSRPLEATREAPPPLLCADCARDVAAGEPLDPLDADDDRLPPGSGEIQ